MVGRRPYALGTTTRSIVSQRGMTEDGPTAGRYHPAAGPEPRVSAEHEKTGVSPGFGPQPAS